MEPPPSMPKVPIAAFIAILCSGFVLVPILVFARMWILRDAPKTSWNEFAFLAFTLYGFMVTIDGVLIFKQTMDELRLVKIFPEKKDEWKVIQGMSTPFANMSNFYMSITYSFELWLLKAAFLTYFFPMRRRFGFWLKNYLYLTAVTLASTLASLMFLGFFYCIPIWRNWSPSIDHCMFLESKVGIIIQTSMNLTTDVMIIILAICCFHTINKRSEKWAALVIIAIGILSPIMASMRFMVVIRLVWFPESHSHTELARANSSYGALENYTAMIAFFLPSLRIWYRHRVANKPFIFMRLWYWFVGQPTEPKWNEVIWKIDLDEDGFPVYHIPPESFVSKVKRGFGLRGPRNVVLPDISMVGDTVLSGYIDHRNRRPIPIGKNDSINPLAWYDEDGNLVRLEMEV